MTKSKRKKKKGNIMRRHRNNVRRLGKTRMHKSIPVADGKDAAAANTQRAAAGSF